MHTSLSAMTVTVNRESQSIRGWQSTYLAAQLRRWTRDGSPSSTTTTTTTTMKPVIFASSNFGTPRGTYRPRKWPRYVFDRSIDRWRWHTSSTSTAGGNFPSISPASAWTKLGCRWVLLRHNGSWGTGATLEGRLMRLRRSERIAGMETPPCSWSYRNQSSFPLPTTITTVPRSTSTLLPVVTPLRRSFKLRLFSLNSQNFRQNYKHIDIHTKEKKGVPTVVVWENIKCIVIFLLVWAALGLIPPVWCESTWSTSTITFMLHWHVSDGKGEGGFLSVVRTDDQYRLAHFSSRIGSTTWHEMYHTTAFA